MGYGTGAVMAVAAHDERDAEFARKYNLPIRPVVKGDTKDECYTGEGVAINSGFITGLKTSEAKEAVASFVEREIWGRGPCSIA
ncbi:unnamed protein product [Sphagnum tenellum]